MAIRALLEAFLVSENFQESEVWFGFSSRKFFCVRMIPTPFKEALVYYLFRKLLLDPTFLTVFV